MLQRENLNKPQYHEDFDLKESIVVAEPNLFGGNSTAQERAQRSRQRRDGVNKSKKDRKDKVLESLQFFGGSSESSFNYDFQADDKIDEKKSRQSPQLSLRLPSKSSDDKKDEKKSRQSLMSMRSSKKSSSSETPSSPNTAQATPKIRTPYHYRKDEDNTQLDGKIFPSDQAFSDMILDEGQALPTGSVWADFIAVESLTDKVSNDSLNSFCYVYTHNMRYNGEIIWTLETRSNCDSKGIWGQSSSCTISRREELLRVKIVHKGRRNLGEGWNTREKREFKLADLIRQSGEARQKELMCQ
jgi:hypothetical protein